MRFLVCVLVVMCSINGKAQFFQNADTINKTRFYGVLATEAVLVGGSLVMLNEVWYSQYDRSSFHFFNDNSEWEQMDKTGHMYSSYHLGEFSYRAFKWSGINESKALWYGGSAGSVYLLGMELLDAYADSWGFSWGDIIANTTGSAMFISQQKIWNEQRIRLKFSAHHTKYANMRPKTLGSDFSERLLKDYNGQTYWLSGNLASFLKKETVFPQWLNIAIGYGANGMLTGERNQLSPIYTHRYRQYFLSLDVDWTKINTRPWLQPVLHLLNMIKIPAPTLEYGYNKWKFHGLYF